MSRLIQTLARERGRLDPSTRALLPLIALLLAVPVPLVFGYYYPMFLSYRWHKTLHVLAAVLLLGNILISLIWMAKAERTRDSRVAHFAAKVVNWMDVFFTAPAAIVLLFNGIILATRWGGIFGTSWITLGFFLLLTAGTLWIVFAVPKQERMIRLTTSPEATGTLPSEFFTILHRWYLWGIPAIGLPFAVMFLMVLKPDFW